MNVPVKKIGAIDPDFFLMCEAKEECYMLYWIPTGINS